jgi:phosphate transport system substrate-binding protein
MSPIALSLVLAALGSAEGVTQEPEFHEIFHARADHRIPRYKPSKGLSGQMKSFGTETMVPLMKMWIDGFTKLNPAVAIEMKPWESRRGGAALAEGLTQFIPVSRELLPAEVDQFEKKFGYEPLKIRVAMGSYRTPAKTGALTFCVNASNPVRKLTLAQLDAIYCTSRKRGYPEDITTWGQLGLSGEWTTRKIQPVGVIQPDGISNYVRLTVCAGGELKKEIHEKKIGRPGSALERVLEEVAKDPAAIGYATLYYVKPEVKPVALAETGKGPYLLGSFEEVSSAKFPLSRFIHFYLNKAPGAALDPKVKQFLLYILSRDGQQAVEKEGVFMPLPAKIVEQERGKLE